MALVALVIGLLVGAGITYALLGPIPSKTTTVTQNIAQEVADAYNVHLQEIWSKNLTALAADYMNNATVQIAGQTPGLNGLYEGAVNVGILHHSLFSIPFVTVNIANQSDMVYVSGNGQHATVESNFTMFGNGYPVCTEPCPNIASYVANIGASVSYVSVSNGWMISSEAWNFLALDYCQSLTSSPCSTLLSSPK